ncbi:hypothetical protein [Tepidiforma sp.]|uniref:hypothetical protein n=1 Tax=Tepidiforma sp. TaxID=2682230 RepID=UPI002ADE041A|nr:hypothetical protein [Tepidiforma sp.]
MRRYLMATFAAWAVGAAILRSTLLAPQHCPAITAEDARAAALLAADWIAANQYPDGSYVYEYSIDDDTDLPGYNVVRHAGVTMSLYQLAAAGEPSALRPADLGLEWMLRNLFHHDGWAALRDPADGSVRLGASALMLAGLLQRRLATGDPRYDGLARELARGMLELQLPDGAFLNRWDPAVNAPVPGERSRYATGEAFWALTLMHRIFPGEGWDEPARRVARYLAEDRDRVEGLKYPPWADQWAAYGFGEMAAWGITNSEVAYLERLAGRFGLLVRAESARRDSRRSELTRGRQARAAGAGTWGEGLAGLRQAALADPRLEHLLPAVDERLACIAGILADRQVSAAEADAAPNPERARGAWFTGGVTRMDDQQHALSALLIASQMIESRSQP